MKKLFEYSDKLNSPFEAFLFDTHASHFPVHPHWHYFVEIIYILEGSVQVNYKNKAVTATEGSLVLFHPQVVHSIYTNNNEYCKYGVLKFDINRLNITNSYSPKLSQIISCARDDDKADVFFTSDELKDFSINEIFFDCLREIKDKNYGYDMIVQAKLLTLMVELLRIWRKHGFDTDNVAVSGTKMESIHTITEYIDSHFTQQIMVQDLAEKCSMSYSYFARLFKELYGQSCKEYIEFVRICRVEDMLLFTNHDLNYISQETGFSDCSHLIKVFKKIKGITPKRYRLQRRPKN